MQHEEHPTREHSPTALDYGVGVIVVWITVIIMADVLRRRR